MTNKNTATKRGEHMSDFNDGSKPPSSRVRDPDRILIIDQGPNRPFPKRPRPRYDTIPDPVTPPSKPPEAAEE
jgi:hypothetical protein